MPIYARDCEECGNEWDHLTLSFSGADEEEKEGVICPRCLSKKTGRTGDPNRAMANASRGFNRYGLYTYE